MTGAFGEAAFRLGPRALALPRRPSEFKGPGRVAVVFETTALEPHESGLLGRIESGGLHPYRPPGSRKPDNSQIIFECDADELRQHAPGHPALQAFVTAIDNLEACLPPPKLMGVVNVTPDSFSDGGRFHEPQAAIEHALELVAEGAQILDIGGESTRPGAEPVDADEELHRVLPVLEGLARQTDARLSIDTTKSVVARAALAAGASIVNDVSAGQDDPDMWPLVAEMGCEYVLMHRQGRPRSMQIAPTYDDPVREVCEELRRRVAACLKAGVGATRIIADPGIGFGKRLRHNLALLQHLPELRSLGLPLLLGVSRKSFIGHVTGAEEEKDFRGRSRTDRPVERIGGTAAALTACVWGGAEILRIHDVRIMSEAVQVAHALTQPAPYL